MGAGGGMTLQQLLAMMQATGSGGQGAPPTPMAPGGAPTPMANMIGQGASAVGSPQSMPSGAFPMPAAPAQAAPAPVPTGPSPQLLSMLQMLKGQQTGVAPTGQNAPSGGQNAPADMSMIQRLLAMFGGGGSAGSASQN